MQKLKSEPKELSVMNYNLDLINALNYYNREHNSKQKREWYELWCKKNNLETKSLSKCSDYQFDSCGTIARMSLIGLGLEEKELDSLANSYQKLSDLNLVVKETKAKPVVKDNSQEKINKVIEEIEIQIDEFLIDKIEIPKISIEFLVGEYALNKQNVQEILDWFSPRLKEIQRVVDMGDEQLEEGYSNFSRREIKRLLNLHELIRTELLRISTTRKSKNTVKPKKEKSAIQLTLKTKFKQEDKDLNLTSIHPAAIVGKKEVWFYDVERRKYGVYIANKDSVLGIQGTTITDYDPIKSIQKTIRKPEEFAAKVKNFEKKSYPEFMKLLKTAEQTLRGRTNENIIFLKVF